MVSPFFMLLKFEFLRNKMAEDSHAFDVVADNKRCSECNEDLYP